MCAVFHQWFKCGGFHGMNGSKFGSGVAEAFMIYGLIIVGCGILAIHVTKTWFGDWHVDRYMP